MSGYYDSFSQLDETEKLIKAKEMRDEAWYANLKWLEQAELCHKFKAGDQWSDDEKMKLQAQGREGLVWNYIHPAIELATGVLSQNPTRIYPYPVEKNDAFLCEILEDVVTYIDNNQIDAGAEHTTMFDSAIITGLGDVVVDVGPSPDNPEELNFYERALEAYEVLVDPMSKKADLSDARYVFYDKWLTAEDFKVRYPKQIKHMEEIFTPATTHTNSLSNATSRIDSHYASTPTFEYYDSQNKRILVTQMEYREAYKRYYFLDENNKSKEIQKAEVKEYKQLPGKIAEIYDTKILWMHYIHDRILWEGDSPVYKKNFSLCRMQAYVDRSKRQHTYYGIVKPMIDPQKECNRRWLHAIRLLGAQGVGVMAEIDAFHDLAQAADSWSDPNAITFMARGGLNKIKEKATPIFPDAPMKMEEMNKEAMRLISGINPDLMGIAQQRREPGINLKMRQQQGLTMLSKLFENYRKALKEVYKRKLEIISRYMPDSQIIKILGETDKYAFQQGYIIDQQRGFIAPIREIRNLEYNIRMEDAPGGMNKMMSELAVFMEMLERGFPVDPLTVIDKLDLSPLEKADWKNFIKQSQQAAAEAQKADMQLKATKIENDKQKNIATLQLKTAELQANQQVKAQEIQSKVETETAKTQQKDVASQRTLAAQIAEMEADEQRDLVEILKFVAGLKTNATVKSTTEA